MLQDGAQRHIYVPRNFSECICLFWNLFFQHSGTTCERIYFGIRPDISFASSNKSPDRVGDGVGEKLSIPYRLTATPDCLGADVKGDIYEGLLEKNAEDTKSGAGQCFMPRALIQAMVECIRSETSKGMADPACGTGGFFLAYYAYMIKNHKLDKAQKEYLKYKTFTGWEIVANTTRMCLMNLWIYDLRTNIHFTLKTSRMKYDDLQDFVKCYNPENRHKRKETERFKKFKYEDLIARDKTNLDIFWLKDDSLGDMDNLPDPDESALEIIDNLEAGLNSFKEIIETLNGNAQN